MSLMKLGTLPLTETPDGFEYQVHRYPDLFDVEKTTRPERLVIAPAEEHVELMLKLSEKMPGPFGILYVLLLSRKGAARPGRYQSPELVDRGTMAWFMREFANYFEGDARHHVWIASPNDGSTLVYDQHNVIYAYGPVDEFRAVVEGAGLTRGPVQFPVPHVHAYNSQMDSEEERLLIWWEWRWSSLREGDEWA
jgi:hypothetical protein